METKQPNFKKDFIPELEIEIKEREQIWDPHSEDIKTAYSKISELWNKDQKSRNFIKHLIAAHLPIDQWKRAFNLEKDVVVKCAILGIELAGLKEISEGFAKLSMTKMFIDAKASLAKRTEYTEEEIEKITSERESLPKKVIKSRVAYLSDKSDKVLSQEAIIALYHFSLNAIFFSDELNKTIRKRMVNDVMERTETKLTKPETNKMVYKMSDNIKTDTFEKLLKIKEELENQKNS